MQLNYLLNDNAIIRNIKKALSNTMDKWLLSKEACKAPINNNVRVNEPLQLLCHQLKLCNNNNKITKIIIIKKRSQGSSIYIKYIKK